MVLIRSCRPLVLTMITGFCLGGLFPGKLMAADTLRSLAAPRGLRVGAAAGLALIDSSNTGFRSLVSQQFNSLTPVPPFFPVYIHPKNTGTASEDYSFDVAGAMANFARDNDMTIRGHMLVYYHPTVNPDYLQCPFPAPHPPIRSTPIVPGGSISCMPIGQRTAFLQNHIAAVVGFAESFYPDRVRSWDVVNEAVDFNTGSGTWGVRESDVWGEINPSDRDAYMRLAFQTAYEATGSDPNVRLCYNDFGAEGLNAKSNAIYDLVQRLRAADVPVNCVGFQMHKGFDAEPIWEEPPSVADMKANFQRFVDLGVEVQITEMEINLSTGDADGLSAADLAGQAAQYRNIFNACLAVPGCRSITSWVASDAQSGSAATYPGYGNPSLFDANYQPKPAFNAVIDELRVVQGTAEPSDQIIPFPSPFNPARGESITFRFYWNKSSNVTLKVWDRFGALVWETSMSIAAGFNNVIWNGRNGNGTIVAAGIYYVGMEVDGNIESKQRFGVVK